MLDLALAIGHHLLVFILFGALVAELVLVTPRINAANGFVALAVLIVGFARAIFAAKGWEYYQHNLFFWAKIATFVIIGFLSIAPTLAYLRWKRSGMAPTMQDVGWVRRWLWVQVALFGPLPMFAAVMARGYGAFSD